MAEIGEGDEGTVADAQQFAQRLAIVADVLVASGLAPRRPAESLDRLGRMLSGAAITDEARAQAAKLLEAA